MDSTTLESVDEANAALSVENQLKRRDILRMTLYYLPRLWPNRIWLLLFVGLVLLASRTLGPSHGVGIWLLVALPMGVLGFLLMCGFCVLLQLLFASEKNGVIGPQRIVIEAEGIREYSGAGELFTPWARVKRFDQSKRCLYVLIPGYRAHVIPLRAFTDSAAADLFAATLQARL